jgi:pimeloyl-ACP methyl ester carboxylesterase
VPVLKSFAGGALFGGGWGEGPPTVLALHGWRRSHLDFAPVFDDQDGADRVGALAPDLWGFGATPPPPEPWGSEEYARHLLPLFEEEGVLADRIVLVGHSFGGRVAVRLWGLVPDRIERIVLTGVPLLDRQGRRARPAAPFRLARRLHRMGLVGDQRMEAMRDRYGSPDYRAATGVMRGVFVGLLAEQYTSDLALLGCPVDLVWGEKDTEVPLEVAVRAQALVGDVTLATIPGVGHLVPTEAPRELLRAVVTRGGTATDHRSEVGGDPTGGDPGAGAP